jgi:DNA-binding response OmpR family regulator
MAEPISTFHIIRFGVFETDLQAGELRKNGLKIRLGGQPFQILEMLLAKPGQVVTREELHKKLWPDGTFVDFDHSLNTASTRFARRWGIRLRILVSWRPSRGAVTGSSRQ